MGLTAQALSKSAQANEKGFSLIEIVIAIGLFSLISLAGFSLVSTILSVRERTEGRLERLGALQRVLHLVTSDLQQLTGQSLAIGPAGASFDRVAAGGGAFSVRYEIRDGRLMRIVQGSGAREAPQVLADGLQSATWRTYVPEAGWLGAWPLGDGAESDLAPLAVAVELVLADDVDGLSGVVRRTIEVPRDIPGGRP